MTIQDTDFNDFFDEREPFEKLAAYKPYNYMFAAERMIELLNSKKMSILDVGCADGLLINILRAEKFTGIIDGVEISPRGRKEYYRHNPKDSVLFDDIANIKGQYDVVTSLQTLEHQEKPEILLKKMYDIARHLVIFTVPKGNVIKSPCHRSVIDYYKACEMCESLDARDYFIYMINRDQKYDLSLGGLNCLGMVVIK